MANYASYSIAEPALGCHTWDISSEKSNKITIAF